jgi:hypothetical protein
MTEATLTRRLQTMPTTPAKRQKERNRQDRQRDKDAKRDQRRHEKANAPPKAGGEDPDIAGIIPGPQPRDENEY